MVGGVRGSLLTCVVFSLCHIYLTDVTVYMLFAVIPGTVGGNIDDQIKVYTIEGIVLLR